MFFVSLVADTFSSWFGVEVRRLRSERGLSQETLASKAGLDRTFISMIERGVRKPTLDSASNIARALGLPLSEIVHSVEELDR